MKGPGNRFIPGLGTVGDNRVGEPGVVTLVQQTDQQWPVSAGVAILQSQDGSSHSQVVVHKRLIVAKHGTEDDVLQLIQESGIDGCTRAISSKSIVPDTENIQGCLLQWSFSRNLEHMWHDFDRWKCIVIGLNLSHIGESQLTSAHFAGEQVTNTLCAIAIEP